jgi:drug/metabolite transporter (DMT)-like permease
MNVIREEFNWRGILWRFFLAVGLVAATYNPEGCSFFHWVILPLYKTPPTSPALGEIKPLKVLAGIALIIGWIVFWQATKRSLGGKGILLALALFGGIIWVLIDWQVFSPRGTKAISYLVLFVVALVLATGISWSHITRRLSGQVDTDEIA